MASVGKNGFTPQQMSEILAYIKKYPNKYEAVMQDVVYVDGVKPEQIQTLLDAAPASVAVKIKAAQSKAAAQR